MLRLYYGGSTGPHTNWRDGSLNLAYLRPDGFAGIEPERPGDVGILITRPVESPSGALRITADANGGSVTVAVLDGSGSSLAESTPIKGDVTDVPVRWKKGDFRSLAGKPSRLRFEIQHARVYSFMTA
jgi:hypothetical protein